MSPGRLAGEDPRYGATVYLRAPRGSHATYEDLLRVQKALGDVPALVTVVP